MLVLVLYDDDDGENYDLFVEADNGTEAARLWREFWGYEDDVMPRRMLVVPAESGCQRAVPWEELEEAV
jgi:hypothetical protein